METHRGWNGSTGSPDGSRRDRHVGRRGAGGPRSPRRRRADRTRLGAGHSSIEIESWTIGPGSAGPQTFFASGEQTDFSGGRNTFGFTDEDAGIPATPGHYGTADLLGFSAPGVAFQIQVAYRAPK